MVENIFHAYHVHYLIPTSTLIHRLHLSICEHELFTHVALLCEKDII